jgi:hypothetical protein
MDKGLSAMAKQANLCSLCPWWSEEIVAVAKLMATLFLKNMDLLQCQKYRIE